MARTTKSKAYTKDGKEDQITVLKTKIEVLKAEKKKLQNDVRDLEKQLEISGKPPRPKKEKAKKMTIKEKSIADREKLLAKYRGQTNQLTVDTLLPIDAD
jgi:predicted RNase H-like nuclease (RuvC/YqgF family)